MFPPKILKYLNLRVLQCSQKVTSHRFLCSLNQADFLVVERPNIPAWVRHSGDHEGNKPADDFIILPFVDRVHPTKAPHLVAFTWPKDENEEDVKAVCEILMRPQVSLEDAVAELNKSNIQASNDLVWMLLTRLRNDWFSALVTFTWAKSRADSAHISQMYPFMVDVLGYHKQFPLMWDLVKELVLSDGHACLTVLSKALRRLAKARKYNEAMQAFRGIETFGLPRDVAALNILMDAFVKEGSVEHARKAFDEFTTTISPDSSTFNILIHGYCKVRNLGEAKKILQKAYQPDVFSYTSMLKSYCAMKDFRGAEAVLTEMREKNCNPNVVSYTILMHAYSKAKQTNDAVKVYERMKGERITPDGGFYSAFIFMLCKMGRIDDAWEVFGNCGSELGFLDLRVCNTMITALCKNSQVVGALKVLKRMMDEKCTPEMSTYVPLLKMSCGMKTMKLFAYLMAHMLKNSVCLDYSGYCLLVDKLATCGMVKHASYFFSEMLWKGMIPRRATCSKICQAVIARHLEDSATQIDQVLRSLHDS